MRTLVTGGVRSGKSAYAESLLADGPACYVATGSRPDDRDDAWRARIETHRRRRPATWTTRETDDLPGVLTDASSPMLVDDLGSYVTTQLDRLHAWEAPEADWRSPFDAAVEATLAAIRTVPTDLVLVTSEVGFGLVSPYASGRLFTDELGRLNQRVADACDRVVLVVCGCPLTIKGPEVRP